MSWTQESRSFNKSVYKRLTDSANKYYFNEVSDLTQNIHIGEVWIDPIPVQPNGTFGSIELYTNFALTIDTTVPNHNTWYAETGGNRLKDWIPDKYDNVSLSAYQVVVKGYDGTIIPVGDDGCNWLFDYETGILTFATNPPSSYYSGGAITITGYRYVGRKGADTNVIKKPCRAATTSSTFNSNWSWSSTNSGTITIVSTTTLTIDGVNINGNINPTGTPNFNLVADRILIKDYTSSDLSQNGIYVVTQDGSTSGTWKLTRDNDYNSSSLIYPDAIIFIEQGTANANSIWCMSNYGFTTLNASGVTGEIIFSQGLSGSNGTPNYLAKFSSTGTALVDSILEEINGEYIYVNGSFLSPYKSFCIPHPTKEDYYLIYGCLEGPEHGIYHRGTAEGIGCVFVELPDYWHKLCNQYSVCGLTEYGNYSLYIDKKQKNGFQVKVKGPFWNNFKRVKFDYYVVGERTPIAIEVPVNQLRLHL